MGDEGAETLNLPSSSAERDHGFCERLRKSPRSAENFLPGDGEEVVGPSTLLCARARERSNTDLAEKRWSYRGCVSVKI
jgi:hypothetical protein